jgi:hypothetical protein
MVIFLANSDRFSPAGRLHHRHQSAAPVPGTIVAVHGGRVVRYKRVVMFDVGRPTPNPKQSH